MIAPNPDRDNLAVQLAKRQSKLQSVRRMNDLRIHPGINEKLNLSLNVQARQDEPTLNVGSSPMVELSPDHGCQRIVFFGFESRNRMTVSEVGTP